eukprot:CAMPEP_0202745618 /NCGR_PEP_ID=MMETSP1388-20130828/7515_1 /ASSEMBLY_ACC=CAM_ASM_000864 /TAXON_ID=37098 /ORGANISM="Isochrysis sp, Strain CCMP1244" /LENGTH=68 /DNA_ID=CAMNT_0049412821 /DNA_START=9 /DNA_END=212 /DNA_ORIENTATION=+
MASSALASYLPALVSRSPTAPRLQRLAGRRGLARSQNHISRALCHSSLPSSLPDLTQISARSRPDLGQ